jgi:quercetin dioxygenase-like cupin family protein
MTKTACLCAWLRAGAIGSVHRHPHIQSTPVESGVFDVTVAGCAERLRGGDGFIAPTDAKPRVVAIEAGRLLDSFTPARADFLD